MKPLRLPTVRWPLLLLFVSIGFTALGVFEANRAIRSQRAVAEQALHDYAGFAAWSYEQHLREVLARATAELLEPVNHGEGTHTSARIPDSPELAHYLPWNPRCSCHRPLYGPNPATFFGYELGSDTLGVGVNTHPRPSEGWEVDRPLPTPLPDGYVPGYTAAERRWINDTVSAHIRSQRELGRFVMVIATFDSVPRVLVYTLMPTSWGDTMVYGVEYSMTALTGMLADVMYARGLLPETFTRGRTAREVLQLQVSDANERLLFASESRPDWALDDTASLPATFGSLRVRAQIRPALASALVIGGLPRSRLPFLLGLLAVAGALALVAVGQIRREAELARIRGDFVNSVSHELRTPLAQMRLYLETLRLGRFETDAQRAWSIDNVERETTRLSQLVERILRFSQVGKGTLESMATTDVAAEVERIVDEFQPLALARRASLTTDIAQVPALSLRPDALRHLLLNLLDNAVKYGPTGQTVRVRVESSDDEIRIAVTDEGPGVPPNERESIFEQYRRGRNVGHTAGGGIGLAIVREVASQHGGRVWAEPGDGGRGARFVIALPLLTSRVPRPASREPVSN